MLRPIAAGLAMALSLLLAAPALADTFRLPPTGDVAFVVDAPSGWTGQYDQYGNLQFLAADRSFAVQYSMIVDPAVAGAALPDLAAMIFKSAGAQPYTSAEPGAIAGRSGQTFIGVMQLNGVTLDVHATLVKIDSTHMAGLMTLTRQDITSTQAAAMNALIAGTRLTGL